MLALHYLEAGGGSTARGGAEGGESGGDGVNSMKGTSQYQIVVGGELCKGVGEVSVVDETTGFVEDKEGEDHGRSGVEGVEGRGGTNQPG